MKRTVIINDHEVELVNENKVLFPDAQITKGELISYYRRITPIMLAHIYDRPISMERFPDGITKDGFYQKERPSYFPDWIRSVAIAKKDDGIVNYLLCNDEATLAYLANQACITPHVWASRIGKKEFPDRMIFDLDPSPRTSFKRVRWAAKKLKYFLEKVDLVPFVMTTGSRGLHVVVPLTRDNDFDDVRDFAYQIASELVKRHPQHTTLEMRKAKRADKMFIDIARNAFGQTSVAPYAVRAQKGAPVATPITWDELVTKQVTAQRYTMKNIFRRLAQTKDPWQTIEKYARSITRARRKLNELRQEFD